MQARATPLSPSQWREMLRTAVPPASLRQAGSLEAQEGGRPGAVVLDVRNAYEWDAGHFVGAQRPLEVQVPALQADHGMLFQCIFWHGGRTRSLTPYEFTIGVLR